MPTLPIFFIYHRQAPGIFVEDYQGSGRNTEEKAWRVHIEKRGGTIIEYFDGDPIPPGAEVTFPVLEDMVDLELYDPVTGIYQGNDFGRSSDPGTKAVIPNEDDSWAWVSVQIAVRQSFRLDSGEWSAWQGTVAAETPQTPVCTAYYNEFVPQTAAGVNASRQSFLFFFVSGSYEDFYPERPPDSGPYDTFDLEFDFGAGYADVDLAAYRQTVSLNWTIYTTLTWINSPFSHVRSRATDRYGRHSPFQTLFFRPVAQMQTEPPGLEETPPASGDEITGTSDGSYDEDGAVVRYLWFLNGPHDIHIEGTGATFRVVIPDELGTYYLSLAVFDNDDLESDRVHVTFVVGESGGGQIASFIHYPTGAHYVAVENKNGSGQKQVEVARYDNGAATREALAGFAGHSRPSLWQRQGAARLWGGSGNGTGYVIRASDDEGVNWQTMAIAWTGAYKFGKVKGTFAGGAVGVWVVSEGTSIALRFKYSPDGIHWPADGEAVLIATLSKAQPFTIDESAASGKSVIVVNNGGTIQYESEAYGEAGSWHAV